MIEIVPSKSLQTTIARTISLDGLSANDFRDCVAELLPAPAGQGIVFETPNGRVPAEIASFCRQDPRRNTTSLRRGEACVRTVEHFLSAIYGAGIDNLTVRLKRCGIPFRDFSAEWFTRKLAWAERIELGAPRQLARITEEFSFAEEETGRLLRFLPAAGERLEVSVSIDFPSPVGRLAAEYRSDRDDYAEEVAWARSFVASPLDGQGDKWERIRKIYPILPDDPTESPLITYDADGYLTPLRRPDEPARHKLLDLLGDISLLGFRLSGRIEAIRPGHHFTANAIEKVRQSLK